MKRTSVLFAIVMLLSTMGLAAQGESKDLFIGQWELTIDGAPDGNSKMTVTLSRKDGKITGSFLRGGESSPFTDVTERGKAITLYFESGEHSVFMDMESKGKDEVSGNVMSMFYFKGKRVK